MTQRDKKQSDKNQTDKTRNQLAEGMRKSKSAGSGPGGSSDDGRRGGGVAGQRPIKDDATRFAIGGLRWPD